MRPIATPHEPVDLGGGLAPEVSGGQGSERQRCSAHDVNLVVRSRDVPQVKENGFIA